VIDNVFQDGSVGLHDNEFQHDSSDRSSEEEGKEGEEDDEEHSLQDFLDDTDSSRDSLQIDSYDDEDDYWNSCDDEGAVDYLPDDNNTGAITATDHNSSTAVPRGISYLHQFWGHPRSLLMMEQLEQLLQVLYQQMMNVTLMIT